MKHGFSRAVWGLFLLLAAVFILTNQFGGFFELSVWGIVAAVLSLLIIVQSIASLQFYLLPLPLAVLYIVFQSSLNLPYIRPWTLIVAVLLALAGLAILLPHKKRFNKESRKNFSINHPVKIENGPNDNNPQVNVHFGVVSRRLNAESLETVNLQCSFGAMEIYLDQAKLSQNGAEIFINCNFGAIELILQKQWHVINRLESTLGGVEDHGGASYGETGPQLTLQGNVSFGGIETKYI